jgi:hypothetical protein
MSELVSSPKHDPYIEAVAETLDPQATQLLYDFDSGLLAIQRRAELSEDTAFKANTEGVRFAFTYDTFGAEGITVTSLSSLLTDTVTPSGTMYSLMKRATAEGEVDTGIINIVSYLERLKHRNTTAARVLLGIHALRQNVSIDEVIDAEKERMAEWNAKIDKRNSRKPTSGYDTVIYWRGEQLGGRRLHAVT